MPGSEAITQPPAASTDVSKYITPEMQDNVTKYVLAASLPNFVLKLASKFTGGELLTDRYAQRIFNQAPEAIANVIKDTLGKENGLLPGQSEQFYASTGQAVFDVAKQFLAGHIRQEGWQHIDEFVDKTVEKRVGKGLLAPVAKRLAGHIWGNLKTSLEKQLNVQDSAPDYISKTLESGRDALIGLIDQYTVPHDLWPMPDNTHERTALIDSLKKAAISTLQSPALAHTLAQTAGSLLQGTPLNLMDQFAGTIMLPTLNQQFISKIWNATKTQLQAETEQKLATDGANAPNLMTSLGEISKTFLHDYLGENRWNLANDYVNTNVLSRLSSPSHAIAREIWTGLKQDIQAYTQSDVAPENTVVQTVQLVQQFARGYIGKFGWGAMDQYVNTEIHTRLGDSPRAPLMASIAQQVWGQVKGSLQQALKVDPQDPRNDDFMADTLASGGKLLATVLSPEGVADKITTALPESPLIVKKIWEGVHKDIQAYAQSDVTPENTVAQTAQLVQQFARGYIGKFGWGAIDQYVNTEIHTRLGDSPRAPLMASMAQQMWEQVKEGLQQTLKADPQDLHNDRFLTDTLASGKKLLGTILSREGAIKEGGQFAGSAVKKTTGNIVKMASAEGIGAALGAAGYAQAGVLGYAAGYSAGSTIGGVIGSIAMLWAGEGIQRATESTVTNVMQQLFSSNDVAGQPDTSSFANTLAKLAAKLGLSVETLLINSAGSYLAGQGFTTLDMYIDQQIQSLAVSKNAAGEISDTAPITAATLSILWEQVKLQLTEELFGSDADFAAQRAENDKNGLSELADVLLRKTLKLEPQKSMAEAGKTLLWDVTRYVANGVVNKARDNRAFASGAANSLVFASSAVNRVRANLAVASAFFASYSNSPIEDPEEHAEMEALRNYFEGLENLIINDQTKPEDVIHIALAAFHSPDEEKFANLRERIAASVAQSELKTLLLSIAEQLSPEQLRAFDTINTYVSNDENGTTVHVNNRTSVLAVDTDQLNAIRHHLEAQLALPATATLAGHRASADFVQDFRKLDLQLNTMNYGYTDVGMNLLRNYRNNDGLSSDDRQKITLLFNATQRNEQLFTATTQFLNSEVAHEAVTAPVWNTFQLDAQAPVMVLGNHHVEVTQTDPKVSYTVQDHGALGVMLAIEAKWQIASYGTGQDRQQVPQNADNHVAASTYFYLRPKAGGGIELVYDQARQADAASSSAENAVHTTIAASINNTIIFDSTRAGE